MSLVSQSQLCTMYMCNKSSIKTIIDYRDYGRPMKPFSFTSRTFWLGQTNWTNIFWGIWGIFGQFISTYFGTAMFFIIQALFLQKAYPKYFFEIVIWTWAFWVHSLWLTISNKHWTNFPSKKQLKLWTQNSNVFTYLSKLNSLIRLN